MNGNERESERAEISIPAGLLDFSRLTCDVASQLGCRAD
jgi:hypothetical protein